MLRIALVLTILPLVELALLLTLSKYTSVGFTLSVVIITGLVGAWLLHHAGTSTFRRIRADLAQHRLPAEGMLDGLLILLAGVLLITPGVLTDLTGILLLIPPVRRWGRDRLKAWIKGHFVIQTNFTGGSAGGSPSTSQAEVIDSYVIDSPSAKQDQQL